MGKKWYSYFVVTDDPASPGGPADADRASGLVRASDVSPDESGEPAFTSPASAVVDLTAVYDAAKIVPPAHGYTVLKVADMLRSEHLKSLPADVKQKSIMVALDAAGVKINEIVDDAVRRDRALDTYERVLGKHLEDLRTATAAENKQLEDEIAKRVAELRARIDENTRKVEREREDVAAWQARKSQEEETIANAVSYFVSENPVVVSRTVNTKGDTDAR